MPRAQLASGHFERDHPGESERILVNMYVEENGGDPSRPARLATTPGSVDRDPGNVITGTIRAMAQSDAFAGGAVLILDGTTLRTWFPSSGVFGVITGTVSGTDRADITFTQTECAILSGGVIYVSAGSTVAAVTDPDFPANITSIATIAQRVVMSADDGKWYYSEVLDVDNLTGLNFYSAESAPDNLVAIRRLGESLLTFGRETIEVWYTDGLNANDPFSRASNVVQRGCLCRDSIAVMQNIVMFVADDRTVCQLLGTEPRIVSEPWVVRALKGVDKAEIIASVYEDENHAFYCLNTPTACMVFDMATGKWHKRKSSGSNSWDWSRIATENGRHFAAKRTGSTFVELSRDYATDEQADENTLGADIVREWTAHIPHERGRAPLGSVHLEGSKGIGLANGDGSNPVAEMRISNDNGNTWGNWRSRPLGVMGDYDARSVWHRCGRGKPPQTVLQFRVSEPVKLDVTGVVWGMVA